MKKKEIIIIFLAIILLICINSLYFIVPVSYAGTGASDPFVFDQHMNLLMEPAIFLVLVIIKASNLKSLQLYALTTKRKRR